MQVYSSCFHFLTSNELLTLLASWPHPTTETIHIKVPNNLPRSFSIAIDTINHVFLSEIHSILKPHDPNPACPLFSLLLGHLLEFLIVCPALKCLCLPKLFPWFFFFSHVLLLGDFPHTMFFISSLDLFSEAPGQCVQLPEFSTHRHLTCKCSNSNYLLPKLTLLPAISNSMPHQLPHHPT